MFGDRSVTKPANVSRQISGKHPSVVGEEVSEDFAASGKLAVAPLAGSSMATISGNKINEMSKIINSYVPTLVSFLEERSLIVSAEKSTITLFTPDTLEFKIHPNIQVSGERVKLDQTPKLLGVTFDTMYTF